MGYIKNINLKKIALFNNLSEKAINDINKRCYIKNYKKGNIIFFKDDKADSFFIVLKGEVKVIRTSSSGREKILKKMKDGDFFGEMGIIENKPRSATAVVNKDSTMVVFAKDDFLFLIKKHPEISLNMIGDLSKRLRKADKDIENLSFFNVEMRLKKFFKERGIQSEEKENHFILNNSFTHQELANYIGTSRETITRIFKKLEEKELITYKNDKIILKYDN